MVRPLESLMHVSEFINDGVVCPHCVDDVMRCIIRNPQLSGPLVRSLLGIFNKSPMFHHAVSAEIFTAQENKEAGGEESIERTMVVGAMIGMLLALTVADSVDVEVQEAVN